MKTKGRNICGCEKGVFACRVHAHPDTTHTPTLDIDTLALIDRITNEPAFREFTIQAVNSHEALLEAAKEALEVIEENRHQRADENDCASFASPCENRLKAVIARAEGGK